MRKSVSDRLRDKTEVTDGCWLWRGHALPKGYGVMSVGGSPKLTHRLSWEQEHGPIPPGLMVLHRCDNPPCLRPSHLFLGTAADNTNDMIAKGRARPAHVIGERQGTSKLTDAKVLAMRERYALVPSLPALAREFGVTVPTVWKVIHRKAWKHVT